MADTPWLGDTVSLVDAFRSGDRSPVEELDATLTAIETSELNAFTTLDPERALAAAKQADVSQPFGGVPLGVKALTPVEGWANDRCSVALQGEVAEHTSLHVERLLDAGMVPVGQCNASEFGGLNVSVNKLYGVTHNPWQIGRTAGGSSGGSAAAVAGGLVTIATGGDGGGSIRIPSSCNGVFGLKPSRGRMIDEQPGARPLDLAVQGVVSRTVRDTAGNTQPLTARPELGLVNGNAMVYVGTGRYLGVTDLSDRGQQTIYAIKDRLDSSNWGNPRTSGNFVQQTMTQSTCPTGSTVCVPVSVAARARTMRRRSRFASVATILGA